MEKGEHLCVLGEFVCFSAKHISANYLSKDCCDLQACSLCYQIGYYTQTLHLFVVFFLNHIPCRYG